MSASKNDFVRTQLQRQRELRDPKISRVLTHWIFHAMDQGPPHPDHKALNNGVAPVDWAGWEKYSPPLGEGCMCGISGVTTGRARRMLESGEAFDLTKNAPMELGPEPGWSRKELEATVFGKQKRRTKKKTAEEKLLDFFNEALRPIIHEHPGIFVSKLYKEVPGVSRSKVLDAIFCAAMKGEVIQTLKDDIMRVRLS